MRLRRAFLQLAGALDGLYLEVTQPYFQDPWSRACESVCGKVAPPEAARRIADTIRCLATAWLLEQTGARVGAGALIATAEAGGEGWARRVEAPR